jgi:hypothetical protein
MPPYLIEMCGGSLSRGLEMRLDTTTNMLSEPHLERLIYMHLTKDVILQGEYVRMNRKWMKIGSILATLILVSSALYIYSRSIDSKSDVFAENSQELSLTYPTFLTEAAATYLEQEAGISYYVNTTGPLNLNTAKNALVNIENITSDYVIGSIGSQVFSSSDDYPHCFVHKDGWIVVYYLKPTTQNKAWLGKIIDWSDLSQISYPITSNLLYDGLNYIATQTLGISITNAKYYHFQYSTATRLLFAIKRAESGQTATFNIKIPDTLTIHERSWSCYSTRYISYTFKIDTNQISRAGGRNYGCTEITEVILGPNIFHTVSISADGSPYSGQFACACLILLYH